jgi:phosphate transport system protein
MRTLLDDELDKVRAEISLLGAQASHATALSMHALLHCDLQEARQVKRNDRLTDELRYRVETTCLTLIATQQPVARDLRELIAATFVAVELERCADYAKGIAKAARRISRANTTIRPYNLSEMQQCATDMLERAVKAFLSVDVNLARAVITDDNIVDKHYEQLMNRVMVDMAEQTLPIDSGIWLIHAGHCLERFADRATNVAERVLFIESGEYSGDLNGAREKRRSPPPVSTEAAAFEQGLPA